MTDKNAPTIHGFSPALQSQTFQPSSPLWQRVPSRDAQGQRLSDFMILIRGLRQQPEQRRREKIERLICLLDHYKDIVVFADLNLKINVLWVSIKPRPGMILEMATAINFHLPEARLIAEKIER